MFHICPTKGFHKSATLMYTRYGISVWLIILFVIIQHSCRIYGGAVQCDDGFFACTDGSCILNEWKCDNGKDCENSEDESSEVCARPHFAKGSLTGKINNVSLENVGLLFDKLENGVYKARLVPLAHGLIHYLPTLINEIFTVINWMVFMPDAEKRCTRVAMVKYTSGQTVIVRQTLLYDVTAKPVTNVDTNITGTLPVINPEHPVLVGDYSKIYNHQFPGTIQSYSKRKYINGHFVNVYTVNQTISCDEFAPNTAPSHSLTANISVFNISIALGTDGKKNALSMTANISRQARPHFAQGKLTGLINNVSLENVELLFERAENGLYKARIVPLTGELIHFLPTLINEIFTISDWVVLISNAYRGYANADAEKRCTRIAMVKYTSGQTVNVRQTFFDNVTAEHVTSVHTDIIGTLPIIDPEDSVRIEDYSDVFYQQYQGTIQSFSKRKYTNGHLVNVYIVNQTISCDLFVPYNASWYSTTTNINVFNISIVLDTFGKKNALSMTANISRQDAALLTPASSTVTGARNVKTEDLYMMISISVSSVAFIVISVAVIAVLCYRKKLRSYSTEEGRNETIHPANENSETIELKGGCTSGIYDEIKSVHDEFVSASKDDHGYTYMSASDPIHKHPDTSSHYYLTPTPEHAYTNTQRYEVINNYLDLNQDITSGNFEKMEAGDATSSTISDEYVLPTAKEEQDTAVRAIKDDDYLVPVLLRK